MVKSWTPETHHQKILAYIIYIIYVFPVNMHQIHFWARTKGESNGGGPPKSPFVTLSFQFPGKGQPPPPVLN